jgi:hypothetical protein
MRERSEKMKKQVAFRFSEESISRLEFITEQRDKEMREFNKGMGLPLIDLSKTAVLEHLIQVEYERLQEKK